MSLGLYPVDDPQALRDPRPDTSYIQAGLNGLQLTISGDDGSPSGGSRIVQWGWAPVGLNNALNIAGLPNNLVVVGQIGTVTVTTS